MTYLISGWAGTGLNNRKVNCSQAELAIFTPPPGTTCQSYLSKYLAAGAPGYLLHPQSTSLCEYCPISNANQFLAGSNVYPSERWRNFGLVWIYIFFNIFAAIALYYLFRVRRVNLAGLAKGPAKWVGMAGMAFKRMTREHHENTPSGKEHKNDRAY